MQSVVMWYALLGILLTSGLLLVACLLDGDMPSYPKTTLYMPFKMRRSLPLGSDHALASLARRDTPTISATLTIVLTVVLLLVTFFLLTLFAYILRRRRDSKYAKREATRYATSVHIRQRFPLLGQIATVILPPVRALQARIYAKIPASWHAFAAEWLHDTQDDEHVRLERRKNNTLALLSRSLALGHPASASMPDLRRTETGSEAAAVEKGGDVEEGNAAVNAGCQGFDLPPPARAYRSMPSSLREGRRVRLGEIPEEGSGPGMNPVWLAEQMEKLGTSAQGTTE